MSEKISPNAATGAATVPHPARTLDLAGHDAAEATLRRAWDSGRLPHAWLITGPRGIGKATLAYRFARFALNGGASAFALNGGGSAEDGAENAGGGGLFGDTPAPAPDLRIPPDAAVVHQIAAGSHPDMAVLAPGRPNPETGKTSQDIVVAQVRQAVKFCFMTPASAPWRVIVVDPVEAMNANAANALLKVLEEPPRQALLLLVSHAPARLLPTIRSRCSQLALAALPEAVVIEKLASFRPDLAAEDRTALARLAEGSVGTALALAEAGGLELYRELVDLLAAMPTPETARLHALGDWLNQGGEGSRFRLGGDLLGWWLARLVRAGATGEMPPEVVAGEAAAMRRLLDRVALEQWLELWDKTGRLFDQAETRHLDRKQVVLTLFLDIAARAA